MKKTLISIVLVLIAALCYSQNGIDTCKIVVIRNDTFALIPTQYIKNSNRVKAMNDAQKQLLDSCQRGAFYYETVIDIEKQKQQNLEKILANQSKDIDKLSKINSQLIKDNKFLKKIIAIEAGIIIIALLIIIK